MRYKYINKNGESLHLYAVMTMLNEPNPFMCHRAVLGSTHFTTCFLLQLFYPQFDIVKNEDSIVLNSISRQNDVCTKTMT